MKAPFQMLFIKPACEVADAQSPSGIHASEQAIEALGFGTQRLSQTFLWKT